MRKRILGLCLALATFAAAAAGTENKWRLQFSGNAESAGRIVLELSPSVGEPSSSAEVTPRSFETMKPWSMRCARKSASSR